MTETTIAGTFCWNELGTKDIAAAQAFYKTLFGWTAEEAPMPPEMGGAYTLWQREGTQIGGGYTMPAEMSEQVPPHWLCYVAVDDVDAMAAKAVELGANLSAPPMDIPGVGRMAIFMDPTGATLAIYKGCDRPDRPDLGNSFGSFCWNELHTKDADASKAFYSALFDWEPETDDGPMPYTQWKLGECFVGGMMQIDPKWGEVPSNWMTYVSVEDCDATVAKAVELGAKVLMPGMDIPEVGRFATFHDPTGAVISVITLTAKHHAG